MDLLYKCYSFIFGLLIGSFLNVVILRLPVKKNLTTQRSGCPQCGSQLKWFHNIPVLSYLVLRGKCGFCGQKISIRYPAIEILAGFFSLWFFPNDLTPEALALYFFYFSIACIFLCHFVIDIEHQLLLDSLNLYLLAFIIPYVLLMYPWTYWALGGVLGFGGPLLVTWLFYKIRGQIGLGGGDIKLFGILGLLFGPVGIVFTIFLSCFIGAIVGISLIVFGKMTKEKPMPFGPSILLVASVQIFFPDTAFELQSWMFGLP